MPLNRHWALFEGMRFEGQLGASYDFNGAHKDRMKDGAGMRLCLSLTHNAPIRREIPLEI